MPSNDTYRFPAQARMELIDRVRKELRYRHVIKKESLHHLAVNVTRLPSVRLRKIIAGTVRPGPEEVIALACSLNFNLELSITDPPHAVLLNEVVHEESL